MPYVEVSKNTCVILPTYLSVKCPPTGRRHRPADLSRYHIVLVLYRCEIYHITSEHKLSHLSFSVPRVRRWLSLGMSRSVVRSKFTEVSRWLYHHGDELRLTALMMEAASTSDTSGNFYKTSRPNIPEDSHLHTRRRETLRHHGNECSFSKKGGVFLNRWVTISFLKGLCCVELSSVCSLKFKWTLSTYFTTKGRFVVGLGIHDGWIDLRDLWTYNKI
jgi:hypothetical protein